MLLKLLFLVLIFSNQEEVDFKGKYILEVRVNKTKTASTFLKIENQKFELHSTIPFKGEVFEYGEWQSNGDTLILNTTSRKEKYESKDKYNTNLKKQIYPYKKTEYYILSGEFLCPIDAISRNSSHCFVKQ